MSIKKIILIASGLAAIFILILFKNQIIDFFSFEFGKKNNMIVVLSPVNPNIVRLSADPSNRLLMKVDVRDLNGRPIPLAQVILSTSNNTGSFKQSKIFVDEDGSRFVEYEPPAYNADLFQKINSEVKLTAKIKNSGKESSYTLKLDKTPLILVHGYQSTGGIFDILKEYLISKGFECTAINYKSVNGVIPSSNELEGFMLQQNLAYLSKGMQVGKFDVVAHSMGGLVAKYYSCSENYIKNNNIRKIIFMSVPQKGSPWASLGLNYYKDQGIMDMAPDSDLLTKVFPDMINKGLNKTIQSGSVIAQYDEVVSLESASLDEWGIKTEVFNVGGNNMTVDNILTGNILETANHKNILNNKKVFERVEEMLSTQLPYPLAKK